MIRTLLLTIKRDIKDMFQGKMILIVILLLPLLTNLVVGYEFHEGRMSHIPMAIYDGDNSSLSRMIVQQFREDETFDTVAQVESTKEVENLFNASKVRVGMVIPKDFSQDVGTMKSPNIMMIYDGSHMPIAGAAKSKASEILLTLKTGIFIQMLEGKLNLPHDVAEKIALSIKFTNKTLYNPSNNYSNFLNVGMGTAIVQSGLALMAATAINRRYLRGKKSERIGYLLGKVLFYVLIGWGSLLMSIFVQIKLFGIPYRGNILHSIILSLALAFAVVTFNMVLATWIKHPMISTIISAVIFVPNTIMVGYTWPVLSMPKAYQVMARLYPFYHYVDPLRDLFLKGIAFKDINGHLIWLGGFSAIMLFLCTIGVLIIKPQEEQAVQAKGDDEVAIL